MSKQKKEAKQRLVNIGVNFSGTYEQNQGHRDSLETIANEINFKGNTVEFFEELKKLDSDQPNEKLTDTNLNLKKQNEELQTKIERLQKENETLKNDVSKLLNDKSTETEKLEKENRQLKNDLNELVNKK